MPILDFLFFDAGGGHRAAATALKMAMEQEQRPWQPRLVHLQDILAPADVFKKVLRIDLQEIYNMMLRRGWTLGSEQGLRFMQCVIRLYHGTEVKLMREWWQFRSNAPAPDGVVSVVPNFNRAIFEGLQKTLPGTPYITILTDIADFPPAFWIERQPQYFICGSDRAYRQALDLGHPKARVFQTSGMILHPRFYAPLNVDVAAERAAAGLDPSTPTGLVLFGGYGTGVMKDILRKLDQSGQNVQLILIAGRNESLKRQLEAQPSRIRKHVVGFTSEIPRWMNLADFFIGKPGPGSLSEAVHMGLPAITVRNAWTLPQERYNAEWLSENKLGIVLKNFDSIGQAASELLTGGRLEEMRANAGRIRNRAIFEIPALLDDIMTRRP
ncbi:glycosyltransferase [uncultured Paludibaculum sp.]|uniref:glycosyltransferase n=1 Tax=uncultured Paludibaculum sp. TaxID=1765020 RepID=UPI002AAB5E12|nr:glycosyltransferase [uncultured Paludibaculum sp.]